MEITKRIADAIAAVKKAESIGLDTDSPEVRGARLNLTMVTCTELNRTSSAEIKNLIRQMAVGGALLQRYLGNEFPVMAMLCAITGDSLESVEAQALTLATKLQAVTGLGLTKRKIN